jgi:prepilin-type N-terminal cleavage/methylation domain-containing protein
VTGAACKGRRAWRCAAFTLIELIAVLAVVSVLAGILYPTARSVRNATLKARARVRLNHWAGAVESYRVEYGYYPVFHSSGLINGGAALDPAGEHLFHDVLAGRRRDGSPLNGAEAGSAASQNPRSLTFHAFSPGEFAPGTNLLGDEFIGSQVVVVYDRNLDGVINAGDYPTGWPALVGASPGSGDIPSSGLVLGVALYALDPTSTPGRPEFLCSWK